jgi:ankyrin repeat protein
MFAATGCNGCITATNRNDVELVKLLPAKDADVNNRSLNGSTVLIQAVTDRNIELVKLLLSKGADVNAKDTGLPQTI